VFILLAGTVGCSEELGPEQRETTSVSGVVREGNRPVSGGWIEFLPVEGAVGDLRSAPIGSDGRFSLEGVAVGRNAVGLVATKVSDPRLRREFDTLGTSIRRNIPSGLSVVLTIDLLEEHYRAEGQRAR
jgi:hypothetical protein